MPDETRVFDVTKPSHVSPSATSRPVIVGHHPEASDPMVKDESRDGADKPTAEPMRISVSDEAPAEETSSDEKLAVTGFPAENEPEESALTGPAPEAETKIDDSRGAPAVFSVPEETKPATTAGLAEDSPHPTDTAFSPIAEIPPEPQPDAGLTQPSQPEAHIEGLHFDDPKRRRRWPLVSLLIILALLIGGYLLIDAGVIGSGINLPFHVFKQKTQNAASTTPPANNSPASRVPTIPAGFKEYKLNGTSILFAAPTAWGDPTSTPEPGYSKRGDNNQSDGTYAYLVDFATNKDVQIAVTSAKYLPVARDRLYYDYLQWCTGTNDGKIYESILNFSTASKVDTPTTITCDQGPVVNATKLDSATIVQAKAQDNSGKVVGDIYTKNLSDPALVVFRVKDAAMTNGADIKQLLGTVQLNSSTQ